VPHCRPRVLKRLMRRGKFSNSPIPSGSDRQLGKEGQNVRDYRLCNRGRIRHPVVLAFDASDQVKHSGVSV
jgi:hypothetical protein